MNTKIRLALASLLLFGAIAQAAGTASQPSSAVPMVTSTPFSTEDWKGKPEQDRFNIGALTGLGVVNATPGFALMGVAAVKVLDQGFIPEINDSVWVETEMGPVFAKGSTAFSFSGHMRWNFVKDDDWTFYALAGIGGSSTGEKLGDKFEIYPRFGVGAIWKVLADFDVRLEVSHELIVVGPQFEF